MRASNRTKLFVLLLSTPLWLCVAELGYRGILRAQGDRTSAADVRAEILETVSRLTEAVGASGDDAGKNDWALDGHHVHPYFGIERYDVRESIELELERKRREPVRAYTIVITGGSVADGFARGEGRTELLRRLRADGPWEGERRVRVLSLAQAGLKQPQQLGQLAYLLSMSVVPDAVINLDGFNEIALGLDNSLNGAQPAFPFLPFWVQVASEDVEDRAGLDLLLDGRQAQREAVALAEWTIDWKAYESRLLGRILQHRLDRIEQRAISAQKAYVELHLARDAGSRLRGPVVSPEPASIETLVDTWYSSSRAMAAVCRDRSIQYLHVLQPTLHDSGSKPLTAIEVEKSGCNEAWKAGVRNGYPMLRAAGRKLLEAGTHFADASQLFARVERTLYHDHCHFGADGNRLLANFIVDELLRGFEPEARALATPSFEVVPDRWESTQVKRRMEIGGVPHFVCMPEGELELALPSGAVLVHGSFGLLPPSYDVGRTDGVLFIVELAADGDSAPIRLFERVLDPLADPADRGKQVFRVTLPEHAGGSLLLRTTNLPGKTGDSDGSYWSEIDIR